MHSNIKIYLVAFLCFTELTIAGDIGRINDLLDRADREAKKMSVPASKDKAAEKAAEDVIRTFESPVFRKRVNDEISRLQHRLIPDRSKSPAETLRAAEHRQSFLRDDERIYIFISSSVPMGTLKNYAADIDRLNDPQIIFVMRGFVNGMEKIGPTVAFIKSLLTKDPDCSALDRCPAYQVSVRIDPLLFSRYGIDAVPAIMYVTGVDSTDAERSEGLADNTAISDAYVIRGDVSLQYALTSMARKSKKDRVAELVNWLRKGFYP